MPGASNRIADHQAVGQRTAVMGAACADREVGVPAASHDDRLAFEVTGQHRAVGEFSERYAAGKIRSFGFFLGHWQMGRTDATCLGAAGIFSILRTKYRDCQLQMDPLGPRPWPSADFENFENSDSANPSSVALVA